LSNNEIQSTINNADSGSTITFLGANYNNISIKIDKTLNIVSNVRTTLHSSSNNSKNSISTVFYFKEGSFGSNISGLNIIADKNGIVVNNSNSIKIYNNHITSAYDSAIIIV